MSSPTKDDIKDLINFAAVALDNNIGMRLAPDIGQPKARDIASELRTIGESLVAVANAIEDLADAVRETKP